ncbi:protein Son-like isoform X2 [Diprion similis]|uniref:protein Son-like isoform X2 n=2 Tax=Diprion similis TaxID=362088 RepID=UPI001EF82D19|nr:protein Son-like isoform X2 [Diprion similis]
MANLFDIANLITTVGVDAVKIKPEPGLPEKSSNEILTELFSTFDADEGIISPGSGDNEIAKDISVKTEKSAKLKKKKSKKKHKHKDKKRKKKIKKNSSDSDSEAGDGSKKRKKHKKKSKRKRDSSSSRTSESDEQKQKVQKIDGDGFKENSKISENYLNDEIDKATKGNANKKVSKLAEIPLIKTEPGLAKPDHSASQDEALLEPSSLRQPFVANKINKDDSKDIVMPRLLENPKQAAPGKILIKNLKHSIVYSEVVKEVENKAREKAARMEDGELSDSSGIDRTPTLSPSPSRCDDRGTPSLSPESNRSIVRTPSPILRLQQVGLTPKNDLRMILKEKEKKRREEMKSKLRNGKREREHKTHRDSNDKDHGEKHQRKSGSRERKRSKSKTHSRSQRSRSNGKERSREKSRDRRDREKSRDTWDHEWNRDRRKASKDGDKDRYRSRSRDRSRDRRNNRGRTRSRERKERIEIDKKKLLEIARKNAISMIQQGTLPLAQQDKVIAAIQAGGKSVDELTDFCKSLSKSEALGELSSISSDDDGSNSEKGFHHPFLVKDRPNSIIMNIRDAKQLPTKTFQEKAAESSIQLRLQFPVSSGQLHRKTENEWVPVNPKKPGPKKPTAPATAPSEPLAIMPAPTQAAAPVHASVPTPAPAPIPPPTPTPQLPIFSEPSPLKNVDIGCIVSQRLAAMRKLRENPNDVQAMNEMYRAQSGMKSWAESKQMPGQFTGSTGVKVLSASELSAGYQAWARKRVDELRLVSIGLYPPEGLLQAHNYIGEETTSAAQCSLIFVWINC